MRIDAYNQIQQIYGSKSIKKTEEKRVTSSSFKDQLLLSAAGKAWNIIYNRKNPLSSLVACASFSDTFTGKV